MDDLQTILDHLEDRRLDYVVARARTNTDAQGYKDAGISKASFYSWSEEERANLNEIAQRFKRETALRSMRVFEEAAEKAAQKITRLIDSRNDSIALSAAKDVSDRVHGKPLQKADITSQGEKIVFEVKYADELQHNTTETP